VVNQQGFFETVLQALERLEIPYMIAGSVAAIVYGEPRLTNDMDVIVELELPAVEPLAQAFRPPDFYCPPTASILEAMRRRSQFNILHVASGSKVDLILRKHTEHGAAEFVRKQLQPLTPALNAYCASPEDIVIAKLDFHRKGQSEKHISDVAGILRTQGNALDREYLEAWVKKLALEDPWRKSQERSARP
jgi:hypothetical protein